MNDETLREDAAESETASYRTRTYNPLIKSQRDDSATTNLPSTSGEPTAATSNNPSSSETNDAELKAITLDSELTRVIQAWPTLPGPMRRAVLALIGSDSNPRKDEP